MYCAFCQISTVSNGPLILVRCIAPKVFVQESWEYVCTVVYPAENLVIYRVPTIFILLLVLYRAKAKSLIVIQ